VRSGGAAKLVVVTTLLGCSTAPAPEAFSTPDASNMRQVASPQVGGSVSGRADAGGLCAHDYGTCPADPPEAGAPCAADPTLLCEYGADPLVRCNAVARCAPDGGWAVSMGPDGGDSGCPTVLPAACPPTRAAAEDASVECSPIALLYCFYPDGMCSCEPGGDVTLDGSAVYAWTCDDMPGGGCPSIRPRLGTACTEGLYCSYTPYCDPDESSCVCGAWRQMLCPGLMDALNTLL
jgi:hypothetical protein